jgi:hypothetical protein
MKPAYEHVLYDTSKQPMRCYGVALNQMNNLGVGINSYVNKIQIS